MIWTLKKLVARRSARKATAPESNPAPADTTVEATDSTTERAEAVESAQQAALAEDAGDSAGSAPDADTEATDAETADPHAQARDTRDEATRSSEGTSPTEPDAEAAEPQTAGGPDTAAEPKAAATEPNTSDADPNAAASEKDAAPGTGEQPAAKPAKRRRAPKLDALLAADVETARKAVLEVAPESEVGEHAGVSAEDDRVVTHLFESNVSGYKGWQWFAVLARVPRGKTATVSEVGLLPSERSLLSPEWVPWAERVRPEEKKQAEAEQSGDDTDAGQDGDSGGK